MSFVIQEKTHSESNQNIVTNKKEELKTPVNTNVLIQNSTSSLVSLADNTETFVFQSPLLNELSQNFKESDSSIHSTAEFVQTLRLNPSIEYNPAIILTDTELHIDPLIDAEELKTLHRLVERNNKPEWEIILYNDNLIRLQLSKICKDFLEKNIGMDFDDRVFFCNFLISRILGSLASAECGSDQRALLKTAKLPNFEIFEAAMRLELFEILLSQHHNQISTHFQDYGQFQMGLKQRHLSLHSLLTKDGFHLNPIPNFMEQMIPSNLQYAWSLAQYRTDSTQPYQLQPCLIEKTLIHNPSEITALGLLLKNNISNFNPWIQSKDHPIHVKLNEICARFLTPYTLWDMDDKLERCKQFTYEVVDTLINQEASLTHSHLKIVEKLPCFESLEIALRIHLGHLIITQQQKQINESFKKSKEFPADLDARKIALDYFVTKNGFYLSLPTNEPLIPFSHLDSIANECIRLALMTPSLDKNIASYEQLISDKSKALKLEGSATSLAYFQTYLRANLAIKIIFEQIKAFKEEFQTKGTYDATKIENAFSKIYEFYSKTGNFPIIRIDFIIQQIIKILDLDMASKLPFVALGNKITEEKYAKIEALNQPKSFFSSISLFSSKPMETEASVRNLADKKLNSIGLALTHWNQLLISPRFPVESNEDFELIPVEQPFKINDFDNYLILKGDVGKTSREPHTIIEDYHPNIPINITNSEQPAASENLEILNSFPAVLSNIPVSIEPVKIRATNFDIPLVSYVNIAFASVFSTDSTDREKWNKLPKIVQRDVLRHCFHFGVGNCKGEAEELACRVFNSRLSTTFQREFDVLNKTLFHSVAIGLNDHFVQIGTKLLELYYTEQTVNNPGGFMQELRKLPEEGRFYHYVYDMAKAAKVHIDDWDAEFAKYNWNLGTMMNLSIQALERCLHTTGV